MIPSRIGVKFEGGYFIGVIRAGDVCYALIVAPGCTEVRLAQKNSNGQTTVTQSVNNGVLNTHEMNDDFYSVAQYCCNLTEGGYTDWYLPSRDELELCYRYLKPRADYNTTYSDGNFLGNLGFANGTNPNSVPVGTPYTTTNPAQTAVIAFWAGSVDAFSSAYYWTSTEYTARTSYVLIQNFDYGHQCWDGKTDSGNRVRAVRCVLIEQGD